MLKDEVNKKSQLKKKNKKMTQVNPGLPSKTRIIGLK